MRSTLCEAVARCHLRRLRGIAASAPLPAAVMALVIAAAPFVLFRLGGAVGAEVADSVATAGVAEGLVLGPLLAAAVAGATLAVAAPARSALGKPDRGRPCRRGRGGHRPRARSRDCRLGRRGAVARCRLRRTCRRASVRDGAGSRARGRDARCRSCRGRRRRRQRSEPAAGSTAARWLFWPEGWAGSPWGSLSGLPRSGRLRSCPRRFAMQARPGLRSRVSCAVGVALAAGWVCLAATRPAPRSRRRAVGRSARRRLPRAGCGGRAARAEG